MDMMFYLENNPIKTDMRLVLEVGLEAAYLYHVLETWDDYGDWVDKGEYVPDGWRCATIEDVKKITGLGRKKQDRWLKILKEFNLISSKVGGLPGRRLFRLKELEYMTPVWEIKKKERTGYVYYLHNIAGTKIGRSKNYNDRRRMIGTEIPLKIVHADSFYVYDMFQAEKDLHELFDSNRGLGEWFNMTAEELQLGEQHLVSKYCGSRDNNTPYEEIMMLIEEEKKNNT